MAPSSPVHGYRALDLSLDGRAFDSRPPHCRLTTLGKLFIPMRLCYQAVSIDTGQRAVTPYGWEGKRRSGVALVMRHRL